MQYDTVRRTARQIYIGQTLRIRTETKISHPATVEYIHPSGKWIMLRIRLANGSSYRECFQTFDLVKMGVIKPRTKDI